MAKRWYVIHTYSGYENKVKDDLEHRIASYNLADQVVDGKREVKESKVFPGYVLVRMQVDDNSWAVVRNTPGVTGFAGINGKPTPLTRDEYHKIMRRTKEAPATTSAHPRTTVNFELGQPVRVTSGPLEAFDGIISEINAESGKLKVMLTIFGRETPVELGVDQVVSLV